MKKQTGIWLDFKEASVIELKGEEVVITTISSEIENFNPKGGARSKSSWGPMDKISESKYLERRKHQERAYYQKLLKAIQKADELYIFGPAEAKNGLVKMIESKSDFKPLLKGVKSADSMTENQKIEEVKVFFKKQQKTF